jgi:hypothetical protein
MSHLPSLHTALPLLGLEQAFAHFPQFFGSFEVFTHAPLQSVSSLEQLLLHAPLEQTSPSAQVVLQSPQWSGSLFVSMQALPHRV